jgi:hypothetical protein
MTTITDQQEKFEIAWKMLEEKGFTIGERHKIKQIFGEWGKDHMKDVEKKHDFYVSKLKEGKLNYGFDKEEHAEFFNALVKFSPNTDTEKLINVMRIVSKLLDTDTGYNF